MPRKGHKKSRSGCLECKKRHVKCDETPGPSCVNCKTANIKCSYAKQPRATSSSITTSPTASTSNIQSPPTSVELDFNRSVINSLSSIHTPPLHPLSSTSVNLNHLELLHNFSTEVHKSWVTDTDVTARYLQTCVRVGLQYPFLMHELLALSALHLSIKRPEQFAFYREQASTLQALAVQGCTEPLFNINNENCVAVFLFASITGMHSFCETLTYRDGNFNNFLDKIISSINLLRGVRTVTGQCWESLRNSELAEYLDHGSAMHQLPVQPLREIDTLRLMVRDADLKETSHRAYDQAIQELEKVFTSERLIDSADGTISMLFAWLVTSDASFTDLLAQRRPEALIILAYFGIILHNRRTSWAIQDAGQFLIQSITQYLGSHWARWLEWPNSVIGVTT